jgi:hypothetical protein
MDWFERLTGFRETDYQSTRAKLEVNGDRLKSLVNGKTYGIGQLELISLKELRDRVSEAGMMPGKLKVAVVQGDVRRMHQSPANAGALFQVASQFNLMEMVSPEITPEHGVTRYQHDHTQGPACAIAAGAATIYRNYFAPVGGQRGQSADRQLNGLVEIGDEVSRTLDRSPDYFWKMRNGYALCTTHGLNSIAEYLGTLNPEQLDDLRGKLLIGVHSDVEVTDAPIENRPRVCQAFCSALPVAYTRISSSDWNAFATLILEAAYEATMLAAVRNAQRGMSNRVLLTRLGGGAFGNHDDWIDAAMRRSLAMMRESDLDVQIVSYGEPSKNILQIAKEFGNAHL